jgi:hypothetical protein
MYPPFPSFVLILTIAFGAYGARANLGRQTPHELAIRGPQRTTSGLQDTNGESLWN